MTQNELKALPALVKNAADPEQVREGERKERYGRREELDDLRSVLASPQGRRFVWRMLDYCGIDKRVFAPNANEMYYAEGIKAVGLMLFRDLADIDPEVYGRLRKEQEKRNGS